MRYLCLIHGSDEQFAALSKTEAEALADEHLAYDDSLRERGHFVVAEALQGPETAMVVRMRKGRIGVTDGPFLETKEQVGGFFLIEAANLDEAIDIAGHIPSARFGSVELRPVRELMARGHEPGAAETVTG